MPAGKASVWFVQHRSIEAAERCSFGELSLCDFLPRLAGPSHCPDLLSRQTAPTHVGWQALWQVNCPSSCSSASTLSGGFARVYFPGGLGPPPRECGALLRYRGCYVRQSPLGVTRPTWQFTSHVQAGHLLDGQKMGPRSSPELSSGRTAIGRSTFRQFFSSRRSSSITFAIFRVPVPGGGLQWLPVMLKNCWFPPRVRRGKRNNYIEEDSNAE